MRHAWAVIWLVCVSCKSGADSSAKPALTAAPAVATASCSELTDCYSHCEARPSDCTTTCDAKGSPAARSANAAVWACVAEHACADETCLRDQCLAQLQACASVVAGAAAPAAAAEAASPPAAGEPTAPVAVSDDDFHLAKNGLTFVPELRIIARGLALGLEGTRRDERHNFTFDLHATTYTIRSEGAGAAGAAAMTETGDWRLDGATIVVTPTGVSIDSVSSYDSHRETSHQQTGGPRVVGA